VVEHLKGARVPVLKMIDTQTEIEFDITTGSSFVNNRHIQICKKATEEYPGLKQLVTLLKSYLKKRDCQSSYSGGISSFVLFYMTLAFYQNRNANKKEGDDLVHAFLGFMEFYSTFDEKKQGLAIDLSLLFPDGGFSQSFPTIFDLD
jgi:non-canonical poly(A) RNA polymerase PAPD5/7